MDQENERRGEPTATLPAEPQVPLDGPLPAEPGPSSTPAERKRVPLWGWLVLALLVIGALAYGFLREDVLLEDDFSTPEVLRTWPYDEMHFSYEGDSYHVTSTADVPTSAYHELPRTVDGLEMTVSVRADRGNPLAILECSTEAVVDDEAGTVTTDGYMFLIDPSNGSYAITTTGERILDEGTLASASQVTVGCTSDGSTTTLTLQVPGADPAQVDDPGGSTFVGIALGTVAQRRGGEIVYDDLRVTGAE